MSQFDVYPSPAARNRAFPYLVQLQADVVGASSRDRVVAPLIPAALLPETDSVLLPWVHLAGAPYRVGVPLMRAMPERLMGTAIGNVGDARSALLNAIDRLFSGV